MILRYFKVTHPVIGPDGVVVSEELADLEISGTDPGDCWAQAEAWRDQHYPGASLFGYFKRAEK